MTGKTHAVCGATTMLLMTVLNPTGMAFGGHEFLPIVGMLSVVPGSYMPDIDIPQSKLGRKFKFISRHLIHRGFTHTLVIPIILGIFMFYVASLGLPILPDLILGFEVGYIMHIVADAFNKKGVPLLWPLTSNHLHIASVLTGSWQETVFLIIWIGGHVFWVLSRF